jgi:hypothetical protein
MDITETLSREVLIEGDGVAAACCARLLTDAKIPCVLAKTARPKLAAVLLGEQTQHMLREIFPSGEGEQDLFAGFTSIRRRIVRWGPEAQALDMPHMGVVAPEGELLRRLWQRVPPLSTASAPQKSWRILSSRGSVPDAVELCFGTRQARIVQVVLASGAEEKACWVESVPGGWLFLLSLGQGTASLICVGSEIERALDESILVTRCIAKRMPEEARIDAYPRMLQMLATQQQLVCGTAAMTFDPLCGEGTGNAVREAFLAAAVVRAALSGEEVEALQAHYASRLQHGFLRHLQICQQFYGSGGDGGFWNAEEETLREGIRMLSLALERQAAPRYRLQHRDLVPIEL